MATTLPPSQPMEAAQGLVGLPLTALLPQHMEHIQGMAMQTLLLLLLMVATHRQEAHLHTLVSSKQRMASSKLHMGVTRHLVTHPQLLQHLLVHGRS